jgi:DNA-binding transcriptional MerR regulator
MLIGEVAAQAGVNVQTIRFDERRGLLKKPRRLPSGYRDYPAEVVKVVRFIKRTQKQGFTLEEIERLLRRLATRSLSAFAAHMLLSPKRERENFARERSGARAPVIALKMVERLTEIYSRCGFEELRREELDLKPVPAVCSLGKGAGAHRARKTVIVGTRGRLMKFWLPAATSTMLMAF